MLESESKKKWREEQEKIKSELNILAGSLKGTRMGSKESQADQIQETILEDAKLKGDSSTDTPPKAPEEIYVQEEFKLPVKPEEPSPTPQPPSEPKASAPAQPITPAQQAPSVEVTPTQTPVAKEPVAAQKVITKEPVPAKVLQPKMPAGVKPQQAITAKFGPNDDQAAQQQRLNETLLYIKEKISKTPTYIDFKKAKGLWDKALELMDVKNYSEALKYAKSSQKEVKKVRLRYLRTKKAMKLAKSQIIALKKEGFDIEVPMKLFTQAESALKGNDFQNAIDCINSCIENLNGLNDNKK